MSALLEASIGLAGTGKTYRLAWAVQQALTGSRWSACVLDVNREWPILAIPDGITVGTVHGVDAVRDQIRAGTRLTIVRPGDRDDDGAAGTLADTCLGNGVILVLPESWRWIPEGRPAPPAIREIIHTWRHPGTRAGLWCDLHHVRDVRKELLDEATLHLFGQTSPRDLDRLRGEFSPECADAVRECAARAIRGQPGWHISLPPLDRLPPYQLRRVPAQE